MNTGSPDPLDVHTFMEREGRRLSSLSAVAGVMFPCVTVMIMRRV